MMNAFLHPRESVFLLIHCVHEDIFLYKGQQFDYESQLYYGYVMM